MFNDTEDRERVRRALANPDHIPDRTDEWWKYILVGIVIAVTVAASLAAEGIWLALKAAGL